jgi:cytochrome c biogenesis protein CcmG, thiol:disulfide interchange protein DsbE
MKKLVIFAPLILFLALAGLFATRLNPNIEISQIPSPLLKHQVPDLTLPPLEGLSNQGFTTTQFKGQIVLLNIFASWCAPCREEHPLLMELAKDPRITLIGLNYKDQPNLAKAFLEKFGNPYAFIGTDPSGRNAIELGAYGVPETFIIGRDGIIVHKFIGALKRDTLMPILEKNL